MTDKSDEAFIIRTVRYFDGNLIDVLANERGWNPLKVYEEMTITIKKKRYVIVRLEDEE